MNEIGIPKTELDTPFLWVDLTRLDLNIAALTEHFQKANVLWRPHMKGIKVPAIAHRAIQAGAVGITCAKLGEAEVMAAANIRDILIANQIVGPLKIKRLVQLAQYYDVKVAVDNEENLTAIGAAAAASGITIGVLVEVDIGMERAGVRPGTPAVRLSQLIESTPGLRYLGLMGWEGQVTTIADPGARKVAAESAIQQLLETAEQCREAGLTVGTISAGGTVTLDTTPFISGVTEIQAGGALFCDVYYQEMQSVTEPSLFVRSTVTSRPASDRLLIDAGFKALPAWKRPPRPIGIGDVRLVSMSAEHGKIVLSKPNEEILVGEAFDFVVGYGDQTVFLHDTLYGIRDGVVEAAWDIQGRGRLT